MQRFLRFETQLRCEITNRPLGIFLASGRVEHAATLSDYARQRMLELLDWYNRKLPVPRLSDGD